VRVQSRFPEILGVVELGTDQGTRVLKGLPPIAAFGVSHGDKQQFMSQMNTGLIVRGRGKDSGTETSGTPGSDQGRGSGDGSTIGMVTISPTVRPTAQEKPVVEAKFVPPPPVIEVVVVPPPPPPPATSTAAAGKRYTT
jgi:hypothetical protein